MDPDQDFFIQLPFDVIRTLFVNYLGPSMVAKLSILSSGLRDLCRTDELWRETCRQELRVSLKSLDLPYRYEYIDEDIEAPAFQINPERPWENSLQRGSQLTFFELYTKLIHPFRGLLNWFMISRGSDWNDILTITVKNGLIRGELWYPANSITGEMRALPDFTIFIDENTDGVYIRNDFVYFNFNFPPNENINRLVTIGTRADLDGVRRPTHAVFGFRSHPHTARRLVKMQDYITENKLSWPKSASLIRRFQGAAYLKLEQLFDGTDIRSQGRQACTKMFYPHLPLIIPKVALDYGLPTGIFKGKFGVSGVELVTVIWGELPNSEGISNFLTGFKTTSDPSRLSTGYLFLFKMSCQIKCSNNDQTNIGKLADLENGPFVETTDGNLVLHEQPFRLPDGFSEENSVDPELISETCKTRFVGRGSVYNPENNTTFNVPAHLIIFSPTRFLVMWLGNIMMAVLFEKLSPDDRFCQFI